MKVGIAHVRMGLGGSEARAMWGIEALKSDHEVTLLTTDAVDLGALNATYGTSIRAGEVSVRRVPRVLRFLGRGDALRSGLFQRFCRSAAADFDVLVSVYNPLDFGVPAIHAVADFSWSRELREEWHAFLPEARRLIHRDGPLREAYLALARRLGCPSGRDVFAGEDVLVANSEFTAGLLRGRFGASDVTVVYPPVAGDARRVAFEDREAGFVCLGRISHEKRIERIVEILGRVRSLGHDVHLHVVGSIPDTPYGRFVRSLCHENRDWVLADGEKRGAAKWELLARHRFAIHACAGEAFGIAVAEMAKAGCVTFVPGFGGPAEIVGDERLWYRDIDDAAQKIDRVLRDPALARDLSACLERRARRFSPERFVAEFRSVVDRFAASNRASGCAHPVEGVAASPRRAERC